jgi:hypothetical protein
MYLMARDGALPPIGYQVLIYPAAELTMTHRRHRYLSADGDDDTLLRRP